MEVKKLDNIDNEIKNILKKEIEKPLQYEYAIKNVFLNKKNKKRYVLLQKIAIIIGFLGIGCTCVMAVSYIYEKIWKDPIVVRQEEQENKIKEEIKDYEKIGLITEADALKIANEILEKLGYKNKEFSEVTLIRGYDSEESKHYLLKSEGILINLNPKTGELEYFGDSSILMKNVSCDNISEKKIKEIAMNIYNNLKTFEKNDNYEIVESKRRNIVYGKNINDLWQVSFAKVYNGSYDKTSIFSVAFAVVNNDIVIYSITEKNKSDFENNPIVITEKEAIEIAENKEKEFSELEISNISAKLSIEKMNIFIYCLENNITNENGELKVSNISRNVWVVNVEHNKMSKPKDATIETVKSLYNKKYYIDATTGEIIGGEQSEFFNN